jgi:hypothetical protein
VRNNTIFCITTYTNVIFSLKGAVLSIKESNYVSLYEKYQRGTAVKGDGGNADIKAYGGAAASPGVGERRG